MQRICCVLLFLGTILSACSIGVTSSQPIPASTTAAPVVVPTDSQPCGYQWANQNLPELSATFQKSVQELQPEAQANAYAFGENCVREDGSAASFSAKETDFNIMLQVSDLTDEAELGEWIVKVMQVIEKIPKEQIVGPQPGRVSITFQAGNDQQMISFYTDQYEALPTALSTSEIYQALQAPGKTRFSH